MKFEWDEDKNTISKEKCWKIPNLRNMIRKR